MRIGGWRYALPQWVRGLVCRRDVERDIDDEIRHHLEQQSEQNVTAGMSPTAARRAALVSFGGVERIKDESRDVRRLSLIDSVGQVRHTLRSLARARVFTVASVATIALAVGAGSAIFALVNAVLLQPLPYPDSDRLVGVWNAFPAMNMPLVRQSAGTLDAYRRLSRSFEAIGGFSDGAVTVTSNDGTLAPERVAMAGVSGSVLAMLRVRPLLGRVLDDSDEAEGAPRVVVVSENYWRTRLAGAATAIGRSLRINGRDYLIVGIVPETFAFPSSDTRIWGIANLRPGQYLGNFGTRAVGRLRPGVSIDAGQRELDAILQRMPELFAEQRPGVSTANVLAMTRARVVLHSLRDDAVGGFDRIVWLVVAIASVLVLVALSNIASLTLARTEARRREFAIRATIGASRARIWWTLLLETGILAIIGGVLGGGIALGAIAWLARLGPTALPDPLLANGGNFMLPRLNELRAGWPLVLAAAVLTSAFAAVSALISVWRIAASDLVPALRDGGRSGTLGQTSRRLRGAFVMAEVALSLVLLSGATVLGRSLHALLVVNAGFDPNNVFTTWTMLGGAAYPTDESVARFYREAVERVGRIPGVAAAAVVSKPPLQFGQTQRVTWVEDAPPAAGVLPAAHPVAEATDGYFRAMGIPVLAGRVFSDENVRHGVDEAVVSRSFAIQYWRDSTGVRALGRRFRPYAVGPWLTIVGVVGDVRDTSLAAPPQAMAYLPEEPGTNAVTDSRPTRAMAFVVRTNRVMPDIGATIERELRAMDHDLATYDSEPMTATISKAGSRTAFVLFLLAAGTAVTLMLGAVGLYGVIAYIVGSREREIGIRIALGLAPERATRMIVRQGAVIIALGTVTGLLAFAAFARLLTSLTFGLRVMDGISIIVSAAFIVVVASMATWIPARRSASIDPASALRSE
jgi:predicted permease